MQLNCRNPGCPSSSFQWVSSPGEKNRHNHRKQPIPPTTNVTGSWNFVGRYRNLSFPYTASFVQDGSTVTGSGVSSDESVQASFTITSGTVLGNHSGSVSGDVITLEIEYSTFGTTGTESLVGLVSLDSTTIGGTWVQPSGLRGTWTGTRIF